MKIVNFEYFDPICIDPSEPETLVIENPEYFRRIVSGLIQQRDLDVGDFVVSDSNKTYIFSKACLLISDIYNCETNSKQIKTKICNLLLSEYQDVVDENEVLLKINQMGIALSNAFPYNISFKDNLTFSDLVKLLDFSLDLQSVDFWERFLEYIQVAYELLGFKMIITVNLKDSISVEEYDKLITDLKYRNIELLMIERHAHEELDDSKHIRIIDNDLCVL